MTQWVHWTPRYKVTTLLSTLVISTHNLSPWFNSFWLTLWSLLYSGIWAHGTYSTRTGVFPSALKHESYFLSSRNLQYSFNRVKVWALWRPLVFSTPSSSNHVFMIAGFVQCWNNKGPFPYCGQKVEILQLYKMFLYAVVVTVPLTGNTWTQSFSV